MTPVDQQFIHDPANGVYGDCQRACFASLLDLPIDAVPHFVEDGCSDDIFFGRIDQFLGQLGLTEIIFNATDVPVVVKACYHLMYGNTVRGTYHVVVALDREVVHDPHPSRAGIIMDGNVQYSYLVKTCM